MISAFTNDTSKTNPTKKSRRNLIVIFLIAALFSTLFPDFSLSV